MFIIIPIISVIHLHLLLLIIIIISVFAEVDAHRMSLRKVVCGIADVVVARARLVLII